MAAIVHEFFRFGFYKRSQGRIARLATFYALVVIVAVGCWSMSQYYADQDAADCKYFHAARVYGDWFVG